MSHDTVGDREPAPSRWTIAAAVVLFFGISIRLLYLFHAVGLEGYVWDDPDDYASKAIELASGATGWRWSFDAVSHWVGGTQYVLPPLYPLFLSAFAAFPGFPLSAQVAQIVLSTTAMACLYLLGRRVHSEKAGLLAALAYSLWLPDVIAVWSTMQEALYVPLILISFVLLFRGLARDDGGAIPLLPAGIGFGVAALTRSMPLYFLPVLALLTWDRRRAAGLVGGFLVVTLPYSAALSLHLGQLTFIENHGGIRIVERYGGVAVAPAPAPAPAPGRGAGEEKWDAPSAIESAATIARAFVTSPGAVLTDWRRAIRSLFHVNGGRLLQIYLGAETKLAATLRKIAVHAFADGLFVIVTLLAPFGIVLCRVSRFAAIVAAWILINVGLTMLSGFGGARLRAPFAPHLVLLAAVVVSGGWRTWARTRTRLAGCGAAGALSLVLASILLPQLPASWSAKADYGVHWPMNPVPKRAAMYGEAGFNVLAVDGAVEFALRPRNDGRVTRVEVYAEGAPTEVAFVGSHEREHRFRFEWPRLELVHVELTASDHASGEPVRALVIVPRR
jgi:hypothetical protein